MANNKNIRIVVPCRIAFPRLSEAVENSLSGKMEYSVRCIIDKNDLETLGKLRNGMKAAFAQKFGEDTTKWPPKFRKEEFFKTHLSEDGKDGCFLRDGDFTESDFLAGCAYFDARNSARPPRKPSSPDCGVQMGEGKWRRLRGDEIENEIYGGCYAKVVVDVWVYDNKETNAKGISVTLKGVLKTGDGDRIGGGSPLDTKECFGEEVEEESDFDSDTYSDL